MAPSISLIIFGMALVSIYFAPAIVGFRRGVSTPWVLLFFNAMVGWTIIGWVVCMIWAVTGGTKAQEAFYRAALPRDH